MIMHMEWTPPATCQPRAAGTASPSIETEGPFSHPLKLGWAWHLLWQGKNVSNMV